MKTSMKERFLILLKPVSVFLFLITGLIVLPANGQDVKLELVKSKVLYCHANNPVTLTVPGVAQKDITVKLNNGTWISGSNGYSLKPDGPGTIAVSVFVHDKLVKNAEFKSVLVLAKANGYKSGDISKAILLTPAKLSAEVDGAEIQTKFKVVSFDACAMIEGDEVCHKTTGDTFSNDQIDLIKKLASGDRLLISEIKAVGTDGTQ